MSRRAYLEDLLQQLYQIIPYLEAELDNIRSYQGYQNILEPIYERFENADDFTYGIIVDLFKEKAKQERESEGDTHARLTEAYILALDRYEEALNIVAEINRELVALD